MKSAIVSSHKKASAVSTAKRPANRANTMRRRAPASGATATKPTRRRADARAVDAVKRAAPVERSRPAFEQRLAMLKRYVRQFGCADVPVEYESPEFGALGRWVANQRAKYQRGAMPQTAIEALEALPGWVWAVRDRGWDQAMAALKAFRDRMGHARVPLRHVEGRFALGAWVARMRRRLRKNEGLPAARRKALLATIPQISENWKRAESEQNWLERYEQIKRYAAKHGHADVPRKYVEDGVNLGVWVNSMRAHHNRGELSRQRVRLLQAIPGWRWARPRAAAVTKKSGGKKR